LNIPSFLYFIPSYKVGDIPTISLCLDKVYNNTFQYFFQMSTPDKLYCQKA
jgi:hypothetical protein